MSESFEDESGGEVATAAPEPDPAARKAHLHAAEGAVLRADELVAGYLPGVNILNGADLYCQENELVGIIGPNGAGKSTLLKALFGLVKISSGSVRLKGGDITNQRADVLVTAGIGFHQGRIVNAWGPESKRLAPSSCRKVHISSVINSSINATVMACPSIVLAP